MRKKLFLGAMAATALISWAAKDPVLMKINGDNVKLSEFEYLYHKNNQQQIEKESLEQYLERFKIYKLKVADAKAAGIDTTKAFIAEFAKYRNDLAQPYMTDSATLLRFAHEAYDRKLREVETMHIMLPLTPDGASYAKADSLRNCILNGEDMGDLAVKYSIDRSAKKNRGNLGYITSGRFPYAFELVAYTTPIGEVSKPFATDFGVHIVKTLAERESRGEVLVAHILKLFPRGANDSIKEALHQQIESLYKELMRGANFEELATKHSDDGSARRGGHLNWFGSGMMVPEFEATSFALANGEISKPIATQFGWHIIKKLDSRGVKSFDECKAGLLETIAADERNNQARDAKVENLKKEYKLKENPKFLAWVEAETKDAFDSTTVEKMKSFNCVAFSYAKAKVMASDVAARLNPKMKLKSQTPAEYVAKVTADMEREALLEHEKDMLPSKHADYANLLNEYYNGMLLFEISNRNVWDKSNTDKKGLENYFQANRAKYAWSKPKFKGVVIYTTNDSIEALVKDRLKTLGGDTIYTTLRKEFKRDVRIEQLLVEKGENPVVDNLVFDGPAAQARDKRYKNYFKYEGRIIEQPEVAADVKGAVTSDYQAQLEADWVARLKEKYPITVNDKVLKQVK